MSLEGSRASAFSAFARLGLLGAHDEALRPAGGERHGRSLTGLPANPALRETEPTPAEATGAIRMAHCAQRIAAMMLEALAALLRGLRVR